MVLHSQKQQVEPSNSTTEPPEKEPRQESDDDTDRFMKAFVANQSTCEVLGFADQRLIYGNVGLKGTPRGSDNDEAETDKVHAKGGGQDKTRYNFKAFPYKRPRLN